MGFVLMKRFLSCLLLFVVLMSVCFSFACFAQAPEVSAKSAVLMDASTGQVLYQKSAFVRLPMASTTKIMTAVIAIESLDLQKEIEISPKATNIEGSSVYLYPNEKLTLESLLYAVLLESANDAASAIAIAVSGSIEAFADKMNEKAEQLGLCNTHFENPHGLDSEKHYTTAYDLAKLSSYALSNETFRKICSTYKKTIPLKGDEGVRVLLNHNKMLDLYQGAIGVKTGFTKKSGRCLVSAAERDGLLLVAVTLNAPNDWKDHTAMLDFGFSRYQKIIYAEKGMYSTSLPVVGGTAEKIKLVNNEELSATLTKAHGEITSRIETPRFLYAPIEKGETVGKIIVLCEGREIACCSLIAEQTVSNASPKGFWARLMSRFRKK